MYDGVGVAVGGAGGDDVAVGGGDGFDDGKGK